MKTVFELHYEKQMILYISERDCSAERKAELFYEFYRYGTTYYEELCDALYLLSCGEAQGSFYITPAGKTYISYVEKNMEDSKLFTSEEIPTFAEDLYDQLCFFMRRFLNCKKTGHCEKNYQPSFFLQNHANDKSHTILQKRLEFGSTM